VYLGAFELYRERVGGVVQLERETLHVADDGGRMCDVETRTVESGSTVASPVTHARYQYGNHLGSASLELTAAAELISYEEYHPYGTSSYRAVNSGVDVSERTYRYTGKERDEETGLGYHGARYYAGWLGRWTASDPIGLGDGPNRYRYARNSPSNLIDPNGMYPPDGNAMDRYILRNQPRDTQDGSINATNAQTTKAAEAAIEPIKKVARAISATILENIRFFREPYDPEEAVEQTLQDPLSPPPGHYMEPMVGDEIRTVTDGHEAGTRAVEAAIDGEEANTEDLKNFGKAVGTALLLGFSFGAFGRRSGGIPSAEEIAARKRKAGIPDQPPSRGGKKHSRREQKSPSTRTPETKGTATQEVTSQRLTSTDFDKLKDSGTVDPSKIRFSQDSIKSDFTNPDFGDVDTLSSKIRKFVETKGKEGIDPDSVKPIRIVEKDGSVYTLDNRRLKAFQDAGVNIPYEKLAEIPKNQEFKFTTTNKGTSIRVRDKAKQR
jgi:RHS repeat-associated protein